MPPRSVCLNVFTTSLGNGKEAGVSVREVDGERMEGVVEQKKEERVEDRGRHDSAQWSPNDSIAAHPESPIATTNPASTFATAPNISLPDDMDYLGAPLGREGRRAQETQGSPTASGPTQPAANASAPAQQYGTPSPLHQQAQQRAQSIAGPNVSYPAGSVPALAQQYGDPYVFRPQGQSNPAPTASYPAGSTPALAQQYGDPYVFRQQGQSNRAPATSYPQ
ncbi:hypothetical protein BU26DRAFT_298822 [Trematosphaeria pertusa]|uniref:Uncharacterized protein n=1 Tax=Trematosphaeria pertusa TaxID=390896 RepID=A0A6A6IL52_9PLEO|nr:uncharacterized protein BU26DRAFT_298822 [Trematosphaeria pertusa]KAF2250270.1 hypothetical protein BU26DRAFT_298822 [Trematosphaeria pertusa]